MFSPSFVSPRHSARSLGWHRLATLLSSIVATATTVSAQLANPPRLSYATYAAQAAQGSVLFGYAVDSAGYAYLGGVYSGCAFLTKLNQTGSAAVWSICLPVGQVNAVAVDSQGYVYAVTFTLRPVISRTSYPCFRQS